MSLLHARTPYDWQLRSRRLTLGQRTLLMVIINVTPDSFSGDGHLVQPVDDDPTPVSTVPLTALRQATNQLAINAAINALDNGADILDLGAESTRPGATPLTSEQEQDRLLPVLEAVLRERPDAILSVDTYHAATARAAARLGAEIINDVSGLLWDLEMPYAVADSGCGLVLMHTRGRPHEWRKQTPLPPDELLPSIFGGLCEGVVTAEAAGIDTDRLVIDPGFGFGKRGKENFTLLAQLCRLNQLDRPILAGLSRKHFLGEAVQTLQPHGLSSADSRRMATVAGNTAAILAGAHILRVHELQPAREAAAIADALLAAG
jgi:dihydropteroate synthase